MVLALCYQQTQGRKGIKSKTLWETVSQSSGIPMAFFFSPGAKLACSCSDVPASLPCNDAFSSSAASSGHEEEEAAARSEGSSQGEHVRAVLPARTWGRVTATLTSAWDPS